MTPIFRFAPSPNGFLHLGHALSALTNESMAQATGGRLFLRIEDIDLIRSREGFVEAIREDLDWLGIRFEEQRRQSLGSADYQAALDQLADLGLLYKSFASRGELAAAVRASEAATGHAYPRDPDGAPRFRRGLVPRDEDKARAERGEPFALRLDMKAALEQRPRTALTFPAIDEACRIQGETPVDPSVWGDVVLARKGLVASYHLAVTVDDALLGTTHVVRGIDLEPATAVHRLLQELLALPVPLYHHHRLLLGSDGLKLSKSLASTSLRQLREEGVTADDIRRRVAV